MEVFLIPWYTMIEFTFNLRLPSSFPRAMEVLDLLMNFQFNMRLESFVGEFKALHRQVNSPVHLQEAAHPLMILLKDSFDLQKEQRWGIVVSWIS